MNNRPLSDLRNKHTEIKQDYMNFESAKGILHDLSNLDLVEMEKEAGRLHALKKFGNGERYGTD